MTNASPELSNVGGCLAERVLQAIQRSALLAQVALHIIVRGVVEFILGGSKASNALLYVGALRCRVLLQGFKSCALVAEHALQFCDTGVGTICIAVELVLQFSLPDEALLKVAGVPLQLCKRGVQVAELQCHVALVDRECVHTVLQAVHSREEVCNSRL